MPTTYTQTDASSTAAENLACGTLAGSVSAKYQRMAVSGTAGVASRSTAIGSAGVGLQIALGMGTDIGGVGTSSVVGACILRWNITTANTNITWAKVDWCDGGADPLGGFTSTAITVTSTLGISLGTTGVKTASVEATSVYTNLLSTASTAYALYYICSSGATMSSVFNYICDQDNTLPLTSSAAPAPSSIFTLAQMHVGH